MAVDLCDCFQEVVYRRTLSKFYLMKHNVGK